ncbi:hypothetical protein QAD02_014298 [Eretmocerus hayati]|uniref:Uncharacterized protein n=1 Tax=Eretmocerus hayati TaxID=131215 RepID=A0ACC2P661_9HYME|nr:hypothetical protein QAD02_014298 [Eretmocerus hayati]
MLRSRLCLPSAVDRRSTNLKRNANGDMDFQHYIAHQIDAADGLPRRKINARDRVYGCYLAPAIIMQRKTRAFLSLRLGARSVNDTAYWGAINDFIFRYDVTSLRNDNLSCDHVMFTSYQFKHW